MPNKNKNKHPTRGGKVDGASKEEGPSETHGMQDYSSHHREAQYSPLFRNQYGRGQGQQEFYGHHNQYNKQPGRYPGHAERTQVRSQLEELKGSVEESGSRHADHVQPNHSDGQCRGEKMMSPPYRLLNQVTKSQSFSENYDKDGNKNRHGRRAGSWDDSQLEFDTARAISESLKSKETENAVVSTDTGDTNFRGENWKPQPKTAWAETDKPAFRVEHQSENDGQSLNRAEAEHFEKQRNEHFKKQQTATEKQQFVTEEISREQNRSEGNQLTVSGETKSTSNSMDDLNEQIKKGEKKKAFEDETKHKTSTDYRHEMYDYKDESLKKQPTATEPQQCVTMELSGRPNRNEENQLAVSGDTKSCSNSNDDLNKQTEKEKKKTALENARKYKTNDDYEHEMYNYKYDAAYKAACEKYEYFWRNADIYSQWHRSKFHVDGKEFNCAEQFMMHRKAELFQDTHIAKKIFKEKNPKSIKALGRQVKHFSEELWASNCLNIVKDANIAKFSQNENLKKQLFDTYPKVLVEASPFDTIWGIGFAQDDWQAWDEKKWRGKNWLGFILTEVRDELMFDKGLIKQEDRQVYLELLYAKKENAKYQGTSVDQVSSFVEKEDFEMVSVPGRNDGEEMPTSKDIQNSGANTEKKSDITSYTTECEFKMSQQNENCEFDGNKMNDLFSEIPDNGNGLDKKPELGIVDARKDSETEKSSLEGEEKEIKEKSQDNHMSIEMEGEATDSLKKGGTGSAEFANENVKNDFDVEDKKTADTSENITDKCKSQDDSINGKLF